MERYRNKSHLIGRNIINIAHKFDSGEIDLLYEGKEGERIIMGGSSGLTIIGILKEDSES